MSVLSNAFDKSVKETLTENSGGAKLNVYTCAAIVYMLQNKLHDEFIDYEYEVLASAKRMNYQIVEYTFNGRGKTFICNISW